MYVTATKLYDFIKCPHKVWRDIYGPQEEKIKEVNPFVQLLWDKGVLHEKNIISEIGGYVDLSTGSLEERALATIEEMKKGTPLIYQGVLIAGHLLGIPDILKRYPDGTYIAVDIKSGSGLEGADEDVGDEGKPKKHYAVQLCLYTDVLERLGFSNKQRKALIIDIHKNTVEYNLVEWWSEYENITGFVLALMGNEVQNKPAFSGICKLCPWYTSCKKWCEDTDDLTRVFYLGRAKRDQLDEELGISSVKQLSDVKVMDILEQKKKDKTFLKGVAEKSLSKLLDRAKIITEIKKPVLHKKLSFPVVKYELFFDIEDDPTQEFVYLHGVYERTSSGERFLDFVATDNTRDAERKAWTKFWQYVRSLPRDNYAVYYYSHHEKTTYKRLQKEYPDIISENELESFFEQPNAIDLYKLVYSSTDWPLSSYSIKDIATYLGFKWRDATPSGALSIQWFNQYLETKDKAVLNRILEYNEDDCKATMVLKDALVKMSAVM